VCFGCVRIISVHFLSHVLLNVASSVFDELLTWTWWATFVPICVMLMFLQLLNCCNKSVNKSCNLMNSYGLLVTVSTYDFIWTCCICVACYSCRSGSRILVDTRLICMCLLSHVRRMLMHVIRHVVMQVDNVPAECIIQLHFTHVHRVPEKKWYTKRISITKSINSQWIISLTHSAENLL